MIIRYSVMFFLLVCFYQTTWAQSPVQPESRLVTTTVNHSERPESRSVETDYYDPLESFRTALIRQVKYPNQAIQLGHEGIVMIRVQLVSNGQIRPVRIVRSAGPLLDAAVLQAVDEVLQRNPLSIPTEASVLRTIDFPIVFRP